MSSSAAYGPPPAPQRRRRGGVVWPLVLIFIGCVFLLQNAGYLPANAWHSLWRLWPVILVLAGIELLLAQRVPWPVLAALAALVLVAGALVTGLSIAPSVASGSTVTRSLQTDLGGATQAAVTVRFGAGELNIGALADPAPAELAVMNYTGPAELAPVPSYSPTGGVGRLDYEANARSGPGYIPFFGSGSDSMRVDVNLAPNVPIASLNVQTGATNAHLDLSNLNVSSVDMSVGAATAWIRLPQAAGKTVAHISSGAATITLEIPQGVAAQIHHKGGLSTMDIDQTRFPLVSEGLYVSPDYAAAQNKVDLSIETGFTTIAVN